MKNKNILIAGGTGFIGGYLTEKLRSDGYRVSILTRSANKRMADTSYRWEPSIGFIDPEALNNQNVIINLSGAGITDKLWTRKRKKVILESRVSSTRLLVESLRTLRSGPNLFINASAIGYYGNRPGEILTEGSAKGEGFLSDVCYKWEESVKRMGKLEIPFAIIRMGIVLGKNGGSLRKLMLPLHFGLKVIFGNGKQPVPWIHIDDVFNIICGLIKGKLSAGIYNGVAPESISMEDFTNMMARSLQKRYLKIRFPERVLKFILGELATVFTDYQKIVTERLPEEKFEYRYPNLENALQDLLRK